MNLDLTVVITALLLLGFLAQWLAWRVRLPGILPLLLTGILLAGLAIFLVVQFVIRPASIAVATLGSRLFWRERAFLAISGRRDMNHLACMHFRELLGREAVYRMRSLPPQAASPRRQVARRLRGKTLFTAQLTHQRFNELLEQGWR